MEYSVRVAARVHVDLDEIYDYWSEHASPEIAFRLKEDLVEGMQRLRFYPFSCPQALEASYREQMLRNTFVRGYRTIFTVSDQVVQIVHVRHGRRQELSRAEIRRFLQDQ